MPRAADPSARGARGAPVLRGAAWATLVLAVVVCLRELVSPVVAVALVFHTVAWLLAEKWFMSGRGLSFGIGAATAALVREVLAPVLIVNALWGRTIYWRGSDLGGQWRDRHRAARDTQGDAASGKSV